MYIASTVFKVYQNDFTVERQQSFEIEEQLSFEKITSKITPKETYGQYEYCSLGERWTIEKQSVTQATMQYLFGFTVFFPVLRDLFLK